MDALSATPLFNRTLGTWLDLPAGVDVYSGHLWYSHHHVFHSIPGGLLAGLLLLHALDGAIPLPL